MYYIKSRVLLGADIKGWDFMERVKVDRPRFDKRLPQLLKAGYKVQEICSRIGCSRATFYRILNQSVSSEEILEWKANKKLRYAKVPHCRLPEDVKDSLIIDYNNRVKGKDLAAKYGISRATVYRIIAERGIKEKKNEKGFISRVNMCILFNWLSGCGQVFRWNSNN